VLFKLCACEFPFLLFGLGEQSRSFVKPHFESKIVGFTDVRRNLFGQDLDCLRNCWFCGRFTNLCCLVVR
jgi:hypothetical protein